MQVLTNKEKKYIGQISTEQVAARMYDRSAIFANGLQAKTNFNYTKRQLENLLKEPSDNSEELIGQLYS